jgi:membrane-associated phospholipid phosphatase
LHQLPAAEKRWCVIEMKRLLLAGIPFRLTDMVVLGGLVFLSVLALIFHGRLERPAALIGANLFFIVINIAALVIIQRLRRKFLRFFIRTAAVQFSCLQIFTAARDLQLLFFNWNNDRVVAWEKAIFGGQPLVWIQKFYSPPLTEWMLFVYVLYVLIYPILGAVIYFRRGEDANEDYLFHLGLINLVCGVGFILFPVDGPMRVEKMRALLTEPLQGGPFTAMAEYIRAHIHGAGGTIPSPHCAVSTVMWFMSWKYTQRGFVLLAPIILSVYISTVYGRFHYVSDMVIGIVVAILVILASPSLQKAWNRRMGAKPGGAS